MSRIGLVTGARAEARCVGGLSCTIACSGADPERARTEASRLVSEGCEALVSFGLAGGLAPDLDPATILLPQAVLAPDGARYPVDGVWRKALCQRLEAGGIMCRGGLLLGSDRLIASPETKRRLFESTAAVAVDMESHALAAVASAEGVPFIVLRAIADRADERVPQAALAALGPDGRLRPLRLLAALTRRPGDLLPLVRLARASRPALEALRAAVAAAGDDLGRPSGARGARPPDHRRA